MDGIPKIIGSDIELGNFLLGVEKAEGTGREASRLLLANMPGVMTTYDMGAYGPTWLSGFGAATPMNASWEPVDARDFGRKWQINGGCCYIDSDHLEIAAPETSNAWEWVAVYYAQLMMVRDAQRRVAKDLASGAAIQVMVCNSDGQGNSWGSHLNFLLTRRAFRNIFERRMHYLVWLASYQASSVIVSGLGKVGSERENRPIDYQLSQRADFFHEIVSHETMVRRPIINSRDESHCYSTGSSSAMPAMARFHHIACDSNLCPTANLLKVGVLQIMLAMVEAESDLIDSTMLLEAPLEAWQAYSRDPSLEAKARTIDGDLLTAVDLQRRLFDAATRFRQAGGCQGIVPRADEILGIWGDTLDMLAARDWQRLSGRLDWVLKRSLLEEAFASNPGLCWDSPEAKYLDLMYSSLLPEDGLFWPCLAGGAVDQVVDPVLIEQFKSTPPLDTRAFARGRLIRGRGNYQIEYVNWDSMRLRFSAGRFRGRPCPVFMDTPLGSTAAECPALLGNGRFQLADIPTDYESITSNNDKETLSWNSTNAQSNRPPTKRRG
jgi:hypothetical protein